jgi:diaminopimelate epimerase
VSASCRVSCEFWSGAGNTFVLIDAANLHAGPALGPLARLASGGAAGRAVDGLLLVAGRRARLLNRDGSKPAFCGNGARCAAAWRMEREGLAGLALRFGPFPLRARRAGRDIAVTVPAPRVVRRYGRPAWLADALGDARAQLREAAWIRAGVPHLVLRLAPGRGAGRLRPGHRARLRRIGARLRRHPAFGRAGVNVTFLWTVGASSRAAGEFRTFERGVEDVTRACGSGALASARALEGGAGPIAVGLRAASGAVLTVRRVGRIWELEGPARRIGRGLLRLPASRCGGRTRRPGG